MRKYWRCGTRTRCCVVRSPGSATSPPTGYGSPSCPDWSRASAGARFLRSPLPPCWPGTGNSSPANGPTPSARRPGRPSTAHTQAPGAVLDEDQRVQDLPDGGVGDRISKACEFALYTPVAPGVVLLGQAQEMVRFLACWR